MSDLSTVERLLHAEPLTGPVVFLTGAGISAESGIPTFRGEEGYWRRGSRHYHPQELATYEAFCSDRALVWSWYLYRRGVCLGARPNAAHEALAILEERRQDQFLLVTQNVDGLHLRAGSTLKRTYQIHGNLDYMRCADECVDELFEMPPGLGEGWGKERQVTASELAQLECPRCGAPARPHVLWFDETYDEARFRFESSLRATMTAGLLVVIGTAGQTNLPLQIGALAARRQIPLVAVNRDPSPFTELAEASSKGVFLRGDAGRWVPDLAQLL